VAELLSIDATSVGVKAKTPEGMGTDNAAIAHVVVLLDRQSGKRRRRAEAVEEVPQPVVDSVAEELVESVDPKPAKKFSF
jgi:2-C-methyl-D-erythritol 2,4-cyclodiphosphate synthase